MFDCHKPQFRIIDILFRIKQSIQRHRRPHQGLITLQPPPVSIQPARLLSRPSRAGDISIHQFKLLLSGNQRQQEFMQPATSIGWIRQS